MFISNFITEELEFLKWLSENIPDFIKAISLIVSYLGQAYISIGIVCLIYWCINKDRGYFFCNSLMITTFFYTFIKGILKEPRPNTHKGYENLEYGGKLTATQGTYSNPSGHTVTTYFMYPTLAYEFKKKWIVILMIVSLILVPLSRMVIGVHFPHNILFGMFIGVMCFVLFSLIIKKFNDKAPLVLTIISFVFVIISLILNTKDSIESAFLLFGFNIGVLLDKLTFNFKVDGDKKTKIIRLITGLISMFIIKLLFDGIFGLIFGSIPYILKGITYFIIAIYASYLYPIIFTKLENKFLTKKEKVND